MRKVHEKSIVLGIGIGMIITSIAGMIYSAGTRKELSQDEIKHLAKVYGMVDRAEIENSSNLLQSSPPAIDKASLENSQAAASTNKVSENTQTVPSSPNASPVIPKKPETNNTANKNNTNSGAISAKKPINSNQAAASTTTSEKRDIAIKINAGDKAQIVAELFNQKGIITNVQEFVNLMKSKNALTRIRAGTYYFHKNEDYNYILNTICNPK